MKSNADLSPIALKRVIKGLIFGCMVLTVVGVPVTTRLIDDPNDARWVISAIGAILIMLYAASGVWAFRLVDRLNDHTKIDPLTGLLSRASVRTHLADLIERSDDEQIAVAVIDLDDFREINDVWGHLVGDEALVEVTTRLRSVVGPTGFVGRLGGVEFLAAWVTPSEAEAEAHAEAIINRIQREPVNVGGASLTSVSVRCGLRLRTGSELGAGVVELLRDAEVALLAAKAQGQDLVRFTPTMSISAVNDERREFELEAARQAGEFEIHFQPEVDIANGAITGAEALLRWRQADGSVARALDFIDDLDRFGITDQLTPLLIAECERLADSMNTEQFVVRLNFNGAQLQNASTLAAIAAAQARTSIQWCLEISEQAILEADPSLLADLRSMVDQGVALALDGFGKGYSSLSELRDLPISVVKIDRSFVKTLTLANAHTSLVSIIHDMAKRLSLEVVAAGIETDEQRLALQAVGCGHGQGWLFGKAMPIDEFVIAVGPTNLQAEAETVGA